MTVPDWLSAALVILVGASFLAWGTTVVWGFFFAQTRFVQRARRQYAELPREARGVDRARVASLAPLLGVAFIAIGISIGTSPTWSGFSEALRLVGIGTGVVAVVALVARVPFIPRWMREIDSGPDEPTHVTFSDAD